MKLKNTSIQIPKFSEPATYQIEIAGELYEQGSEQLKGMQIIIDRADQKTITVLTGRMSDQSDLSGVLNTLYEQHLTVLSVKMLN